MELPNRLIDFRSTLIKPFYKDNSENLDLENDSLSESPEPPIGRSAPIKTIKGSINDTDSPNTLPIEIPINKSKL